MTRQSSHQLASLRCFACTYAIRLSRFAVILVALLLGGCAGQSTEPSDIESSELDAIQQLQKPVICSLPDGDQTRLTWEQCKYAGGHPLLLSIGFGKQAEPIACDLVPISVAGPDFSEDLTCWHYQQGTGIAGQGYSLLAVSSDDRWIVAVRWEARDGYTFSYEIFRNERPTIRQEFESQFGQVFWHWYAHSYYQGGQYANVSFATSPRIGLASGCFAYRNFKEQTASYGAWRVKLLLLSCKPTFGYPILSQVAEVVDLVSW